MYSNQDSFFSDNKIAPILIPIALIFVIVIYFLTIDVTPYNTYYKLAINDRITILNYSHGTPIVYLKNRKTKFNLSIPPSYGAYLVNNDSIIKEANSPFMHIIRDSANVRVTTTWEIHEEYYKPSLTKRVVTN